MAFFAADFVRILVVVVKVAFGRACYWLDTGLVIRRICFNGLTACGFGLLVLVTVAVDFFTGGIATATTGSTFTWSYEMDFSFISWPNGSSN